ncbi:MAG: cell division protein DivIC (FtsB), stabilizes FtsL against RasP cleavage [Chitinophagaceae bacterium]|nr:cell division protein DivIC (FtsB), stabilizes FtsL against RasP cleavage [Chitinophagaceae bacterium]
MVKPVFRFVSNKYFIALCVFLVLIFFFDRNDVFVQMERRKELRSLETQKKYYQAEIDKTQKDLNDLQHNTAALEKLAREKYFMKKDNEDVFIVEPDSSKKADPGQ